jgi:1-acyl-sn-glycerol-3-phosphate acyltransferase
MIFKKTAYDYGRVWANFFNNLLKQLCHLEIVTKGKPQPLSPALIIANHNAIWESQFILPFLKGDLSYILKKNLISWKYLFFALGARSWEPIPLNRQSNTGDFKRMLEGSRARFKKGKNVVIFPQTSRVPVQECLNMSPGGALLGKKLGGPCQIIFINSENWTCGKKFKDFGWIFPGKLHLVYGPFFTEEIVKKESAKTLHAQTIAFFKSCLEDPSLT